MPMEAKKSDIGMIFKGLKFHHTYRQLIHIYFIKPTTNHFLTEVYK